MASIDSRMDDAARLKRLAPPTGDVRLVLDTDADNEIDDQFALVYALLAEELFVEAVYATPYHNERSDGPSDGMERGYDEIVRLLAFLDRTPDGFAFRGSDRYVGDAGAVKSPACADLIDRAQADRDDPLFVVAIGAPTTVASAIQLAPEICEDIVIVWLGDNPQYWPTARHFNLQQDVPAARTLFDSGVPLVHVPCKNVAEHVATTVPELERSLGEEGPLAEYLLDIFRDYGTRRWPGRDVWSKELWELSTIAWLVQPNWVPTAVVHSPVLTGEMTWSHDPARHLMREARHAERDLIVEDFIETVGDR